MVNLKYQNEDLSISDKNQKKIFKTDISYPISKNGYFVDDYPALVEPDFHNYKSTDEAFIIASPKKIDCLAQQIENKNNYHTLEIYDYNSKDFSKIKELVFWKFSQLKFDFKKNSYEEIKKSIVKFAKNYGLLTEGSNIISDEFSKNKNDIDKENIDKWSQNRSIIADKHYYHVILKGEMLSLWLKEIMQMKSLLLLWKALEKEDFTYLNKVFSVNTNIYYTPYKKFTNNEIKLEFNKLNKEYKFPINYKIFPSYNISDQCIMGKLTDNNEKTIIKKNSTTISEDELLKLGFYLLSKLLKIKLTKTFSSYSKDNIGDFFIKFSEYGMLVVPPNLLSYMWFDFYQFTQYNREVGWCSVCGGPEDITNRRSSWEKHKKCSDREAQKKYRDWNYFTHGKKSKEQIINGWKDISWGQAIDIKDIKKWFNKKVKESKKDKKWIVNPFCNNFLNFKL